MQNNNNHTFKRQRPKSPSDMNEEAADVLTKWVAFLPIDCMQPVMCNVKTLEPARPALYLQAIRDIPCFYTSQAIPVHRTSFTKAQLSAFVYSFYVQKLMVSSDVTLDELISIFEQQGVAFNCNKIVLPNESKTIPSGVGVPRLADSVNMSVSEACNVLSRAICYWNKIELCMDASLGSYLRPLPESIQLEQFACFDCTATRAWIRFHSKPTDATKMYSEKTCQLLVSEWPQWLEQMLGYLACVFVENKLKGYTQTTFMQMTEFVHNSVLQSLWWITKDGPTFTNLSKPNAVHNFVAFVKSRIHDSSYTIAASHQPTLPGFQIRHRENNNNRKEDLQFARACVLFCLKNVHDSTDYNALFSGTCADDSGVTIERTAFAKSLEPLRISVVKWSDDSDFPRKPITFPPYAHARETVECHAPSVLLQFCDRL